MGASREPSQGLLTDPRWRKIVSRVAAGREPRLGSLALPAYPALTPSLRPLHSHSASSIRCPWLGSRIPVFPFLHSAQHVRDWNHRRYGTCVEPGHRMSQRFCECTMVVSPWMWPTAPSRARPGSSPMRSRPCNGRRLYASASRPSVIAVTGVTAHAADSQSTMQGPASLRSRCRTIAVSFAGRQQRAH